jgi:putative ATP-dependent endonuclease of OLD family
VCKLRGLIQLNILRLAMVNWRGFERTVLEPRGHVLLVGEPRAGRTAVLTALHRVLDPEATRVVEEFDFFATDLSQDILIEVVLGGLDADLQQRFLGELEFWDLSTRELRDELDDPAALAGTEPVLRLTYRARWDAEEGRAEQVVFWAKGSDPTANDLRRVTRVDRERLPFVSLSPGKPLALAPRGGFRSLLDAENRSGVADALDALTEGVTALSTALSSAPPVAVSLTRIFEPLANYLGIDPATAADFVRFLPDGGSLSALLRSLEPALDLDDSAGYLPLRRHGSTTTEQVATSEVLATAGLSQAVVVLDDFGDRLDTASAERLATLLRRSAGQAWVSTRRPETARSFEADELIRLVRPRVTPAASAPTPRVFHGRQPASRSERSAARQLHRQLLPAMTARAVVVVEGPHDLAALTALAERLDRDHRTLPPAAFAVRMVDAGGGGEGGIDAVPRICALARSLGFRAVAVIDYDNDLTVAADRLAKVQAEADAVVRPPHKVAIERALLTGLSDAEIVSVLTALSGSYVLKAMSPGWQALTGSALTDAAMATIKKTEGGLHPQFIEALGVGAAPRLLAQQILEAAIDLARGARPGGLVQL